MASNFDFVAAEWPPLFDECVRAERYVDSDPRASQIYARRVVEQLVDHIYAVAALPEPYTTDLNALINAAPFRNVVGGEIAGKMNLIRRAGNLAVHESRSLPPDAALRIVRELHHVVYWTAFRYATRPNQIPAGLRFDRSLVGQSGDRVRPLSNAELNALLRRFQAQDEQLAAARAANHDLEAELAALRKQIAEAQAAKLHTADRHDYDESATRDLFIDVLLREAGWNLDDVRDREFPVTGMPTPNGKGRVDYVLWGDDGLPLALVEAKRTRRDPVVGQEQARLYANCLEAMTGQRPLIFYTNGYEHWLWDDAAGYPPRRVSGFYTKDELALAIQRRTLRQSLAHQVIDRAIVERHYQQRAIRAVDAAFEAKQRAALLVMATGSGKTRTVIALVDQLMRAGWVKRVLFLADRVALVNQAVNAFKTHLPAATTVNLVTERASDGRVYVSTYPTIMGLINDVDGEAGSRRFGAGYFDLVVIDEAHRSVYQKYKAIFDYFDSLLVGLTATPKDEVDRNTYGLFHLEDGVPTDAYSLDEAVAEGYLVPPLPVSVPLKFLRQGIRYAELSESEKDEWDALEWSEDGAVPEAVGTEELNKWLFNSDTVDKVLSTLMTKGHRVAGGDRIGKTIIFAKNSEHAKFIGQRFDMAYPEYGGTHARVITHQTEYAQSLIDDFSTKDKPPHIAISVDMLDTGIDVPEVVNVVFFKLVRSKTKFWQMIGRGTRLCPDLFGPGEDKNDFYLFDFCQNLEYFGQPGAGVEGSVQKSLAQRLFEARLGLVTSLDQTDLPEAAESDEDGTQSERGLRTATARGLQTIVQGMNLDNFLVRPERRWVERYADWEQWQELTLEQAGEIAEHLAGLPSSVREDDEEAKRFDLLILRIQLAHLQGDHLLVERLREQVQLIASSLLDQVAIPAVAAQQMLLDEVAGDEWWIDVTLPMLELARRRIRGLVRFLDKRKRATVYANFRDELGDGSVVALPGISVGTNWERFRAKARAYLRDHEDHVALQRLRRNKQLTADDLAALERILLDSGAGGADEINKAAEEAHGLGLFIRSLVGLDRAAATEAFAEFLDGKTYSRDQIDFVQLIVQHLTDNGVMEARRLYESPFTDYAPRGPDVMFSDADVDGLIVILDSVRAHAAPELTAAS